MSGAVRRVSVGWLTIVVLLLSGLMASAPAASADGVQPSSTTADSTAQNAETERLSGANRYATSAAIARRAFPAGADVVYLARGDQFADALAGGMLNDGPILLVPQCGSVSSAVSTEIARLGPSRVFALGGVGAICQATLEAAAAGRPTDRIAGEDRYGTAAKISARAYPEGPDVETLYATSGTAVADAVASGGLTGGPVLLVRADGSYPASVWEEIVRVLPTHVVGLGGEVVISDDTLTTMIGGDERPDRLHGANRYDTAVAIAGRAFPRAPSTVYLARGDTLVDAVAAGSLSDGPVLLLPSSCGTLPPSVATYLSLVTPDRVVALGGSGAVCDATLNLAGAAARPGQVPVVPSISAGSNHTCAVTADGQPHCWGYNGSGQLGDGTTTHRTVPAPVVGLSSDSTRTVVADGGLSCALTVDGAVKCWGSNHEGGLAGPHGPSSPVPVDIPRLGAGTTAHLAIGQKHGCAISITGATRCWGSNSSSQLGIGAPKGAVSTVPVLVPGLGPGQTRHLEAGYLNTCAARTDGSALCWGQNVSGKLGDGTTTERNTPRQVVGLGAGTTAQISTGTDHTCAVTRTGSLKCWGLNHYDTLGVGTLNPDVHTPRDVIGLGSGSTAWVDAQGSGSTCALTTEGAVLCWGQNDFGKLGLGDGVDLQSSPQQVIGLTTGSTAQVSSGTRHNCAVTVDGESLCWGDNQFGKLGDGTETGRTTPVRVAL